MQNTRFISRLKENELRQQISRGGSWHNEYSSAYVFVGGLPYEMNEGDVVIVFSEFGEIVDIRLARDNLTGKSRGYAFLAYEDQRSTTLAVDNFNGVQICGRVIRVDHVRKYKPPKEFLELGKQMESNQYRPTGPDGRGWGKYRQFTEQEQRQIQLFEAEKQRRNQLIKLQIGKE